MLYSELVLEIIKFGIKLTVPNVWDVLKSSFIKRGMEFSGMYCKKR